MGNPTTKPRINLAVDEPIFETINEMARMQGKARATFVMDLLRSVHPALRQTLTVMKAAQAYEGKIPDELRQVIESGLNDVTKSSADQLHMLHDLESAFEDNAAGPEKGETRTASPRGRS